MTKQVGSNCCLSCTQNCKFPFQRKIWAGTYCFVSYYFGIVRKIGEYQPSVTYLPLALADLGSSGIHTFLWYLPLFSLLFDQLRLWLRKYVPANVTIKTPQKVTMKQNSNYLLGYERLLSSLLFVLSLGSPWQDFYLTWPFQIKS